MCGSAPDGCLPLYDDMETLVSLQTWLLNSGRVQEFDTGFVLNSQIFVILAAGLGREGAFGAKPGLPTLFCN